MLTWQQSSCLSPVTYDYWGKEGPRQGVPSLYLPTDGAPGSHAGCSSGACKERPLGLSRWVWVASLSMLQGSCGFMNSSEYTHESESEGYSGTWLPLQHRGAHLHPSHLGCRLGVGGVWCLGEESYQMQDPPVQMVREVEFKGA